MPTKTKKQQRFTTLATSSGYRIGVDLEKVESVRFAPLLPGMPEYSPHLVLGLSARELWVSEDDTERVLELLGIEAASLDLVEETEEETEEVA